MVVDNARRRFLDLDQTFAVKVATWRAKALIQRAF
jgi:hypothetical protein